MPPTRRAFLAAPAAIPLAADDSGRPWLQLTNGRANSYPLYYFTPSMTSDSRYLILHSERTGWVQLYRLDMETGDLRILTDGHTRDSGWGIWCEPHLRGIYNHLSALNPVRREVYYFQDDEVRCTHVDSLANRLVRRMPGRIPIGQSNFSPDGRLFVFIHADADLFRRNFSDRESLQNMGLFSWSSAHQQWRNQTPCTIGVIDTATGDYRDVVRLDYHVHHALFLGNRRVLVNHPKNDNGMWVTNLDGSGYRWLRPRDENGSIVHQVITARGIFYEAVANLPGRKGNRLGCYYPDRDAFEEVLLPQIQGYVHTGWDPAGRFLFFENHGQTHELFSLHYPFRSPVVRKLRSMALYPPRGGQRYHAHPFLSPDRRQLIYTEVIDGFSQVCSLDVHDLVDRNEYWDART
jgi:hypothetical protein